MDHSPSPPDDTRAELIRLGASPEVLEALDAMLEAAGGTDAPGAALVTGRVCRVERSSAIVLTGSGRRLTCRDPRVALCVGDWVTVVGVGGESPAIEAMLPRRSALVRLTSRGRAVAQVLAANMDEVLIVVAADRAVPLSRVERFVTLVLGSGADPVVVLSKADLAPPDVIDKAVAGVAGIAIGVPVLVVSAWTGRGMVALRDRITLGRCAALVGSSGAGKSSLLNALAGSEVAATQDVRGVDGKGRHTTTWRELTVLPGGGAVIDTPGLRGLGVWVDEGGIAAAFGDITELAESCRFGNCGHGREPGCAVTAALAAGSLDRRRLASYERMQEEADLVARRSEDRQHRARSRRR